MEGSRTKSTAALSIANDCSVDSKYPTDTDSGQNATSALARITLH